MLSKIYYCLKVEEMYRGSGISGIIAPKHELLHLLETICC